MRINPIYDGFGVKRKCDICLCDRCIDAIKSRGEKIFVGNRIECGEYDEWNDWYLEVVEEGKAQEKEEPLLECGWCEEGCSELYECLW